MWRTRLLRAAAGRPELRHRPDGSTPVPRARATIEADDAPHLGPASACAGRLPKERAAGRDVPRIHGRRLAPRGAGRAARFGIARSGAAHGGEAPHHRPVRRPRKTGGARLRTDVILHGRGPGAALAALRGHGFLQPWPVLRGGEVAGGGPRGVAGVRAECGEASGARAVAAAGRPHAARPGSAAHKPAPIGVEEHRRL